MSYQARNADRAKGHFADTPQWQIDRDTERGEVFQTDASLKFSTVSVLQRFCEVNNLQLQDANEYGDPGYEKPARGILLANWNDIPQALQDRLEKQGFEMEWEDEWYIDSGRTPSKAYRTQANYHGWESRVMLIDGDVLTPDDDLEEWIEHCQNKASKSLPSWWPQEDITKLGWVRTSEQFEAGLHPGQNDDPRAIARRIREAGDSFLFQVTDKGQFDVNFTVYLKRSIATFERFSLSLRPDDIEDAMGRHSDPYEGTQALRKLPYIEAQLTALQASKVWLELEDFGAWDYGDLVNEDRNLSRILALACRQIRKGQS